MEYVDVDLGKGVDIAAEAVKLLLDCEKTGRNSESPPKICMVPTEFRELSPGSFDPQVVSIGPLHKENKKFQDFEKRKVIYLHKFLSCLNLKPDLTFKACVQKVIDSIENIKACYDGEITNKDAEFAKMMVIDGCFILYFFDSYSSQEESPKNPPANTYQDEFLKNMAFRTRITYDLLRVENQIPLFILKHIFERTISESKKNNHSFF